METFNDVKWKKTTTILCLYGFLKELRPSEPFLTEYLIQPQWVNITVQEAYQDVYPVWTYSYVSILILVFLLTDLLRYKMVIVFEGFAYVATWSLLLWGKGVGQMQIMQVIYAIATSTEVAYFAYIYASVDTPHFLIVTSLTRCSLLLGRFASGVIAQVLISFHLLNFHQLNYFSLVSVILATTVSILLPSVPSSIYFKFSDPPPPGCVDSPTGLCFRRLGTSFRQIGRDLKEQMFGNLYMLKWCMWWAFGMCGNFQVGNFIQPFWETIAPILDDEQRHIYNGATEASATFMGALLSFGMSYLHLNWFLIGELTISFISCLSGLILIGMAYTSNIINAYVGYVVFRSLYQMMITVASYEIARQIKQDTYGLVFGMNTFLALLFQSILTVTVTDENFGLGLAPRIQFYVYGGFWLLLGFIFLSTFFFFLVSNFSLIRNQYSLKDLWLSPNEEAVPVTISDNLDEYPAASCSRREAPIGSVEMQ